MDLEEILRLIDAVTERDISELSIERQGVSIRIVRERVAQPSAKAPAAQSQAERSVDAAHDTSESAREIDDNTHAVTSPIVGTFYGAPSPSAQSYVKVGDRVGKGQILCIVEAMKLMNEIESDTDGTIVEVVAESGRPVEFGELLFRIRLDS